MKLFIFLFSFSLIAQEEDYTKVYSSLKEVTIFEDMAESSKFQNCVKKQGVDLKDEVDDKKLNSISNCFLRDISKEGLLELEKNLGLKQLRFIKDRKADVIKKYLEERLMKGIYGETALNQSPEMKRQRSLKIVDQKTFLNLYKNFLTNNIHMSQASFCLKDQASGSDLKSETRKIVQALEDLQGKGSLKDVWKQCSQKIKSTICNDLKGRGEKLDWNSEDYKKSVCALKQRIRAYRLTLQRVQENIKTLKDAEGGFAFEVEGLQNYTGKNDGEKSIQDLSSLTSYDAYKAFEQENPNYFEDQKKEFEKFCNSKKLDAQKCAEMINQKDMENFNNLKLSVMSEFNNKKNKLNGLNKAELLNSIEVKLLTEKEKKILAGLSSEKEIKKQLDIMLENYKVSLIHELNEKLKAKMAQNNGLAGDAALDEIRFGLENEKEAMMGAIQFRNTIAQYSTVHDDTGKTLGNFSMPIESEKSDLDQYLDDSDAQKWVKNESGKFQGEGDIFQASEDFYDNLFGNN